MKKEKLILKIQEGMEKEDSILISDLNKISIEGNELVRNESIRNETLLRALHNPCFDTNSKEDLDKVIRDLAVSITHYIFRNGSVEDLHAGEFNFANFSEIPLETPIKEISQLTDADMKVLNKEMVDKVGFLLHLFSQAKYFDMNVIMNYPTNFAINWDSPDIEKVKKEHEEILLLMFKLGQMSGKSNS